MEIQVLAWDRNKNVAGSNQLIGSHHSPVIIYVVFVWCGKIVVLYSYTSLKIYKTITINKVVVFTFIFMVTF